MELPPPDPRKMLDSWMEWEMGQTPPGRVIADLKTAGLRQVLEQLVADADAQGQDDADAPAETVGDLIGD